MITSAAKVAVLGQTVARQIFSTATNPIGQTIRLGNTLFRHRLTPDQPDDFSIKDFKEIADQVSETNRVMTMFLASIAASPSGLARSGCAWPSGPRPRRCGCSSSWRRSC
jgi:hypothetical protein